MRKVVFVLCISFFLLQSCSALPFGSSAPTPTRKPSLTPTATITPTHTVMPSVTPSPTIVKIPTVDYNATATPPAYIFNMPTPIPGIPTFPSGASTPAIADVGFEWVKTSESKIYWGICKPNKLNVTAQVSEPKDVYSVVLFMRLRRTTAQIFTEWNRGTGMEPVGDEGLWEQDIYANSVDGHELYRRGWIWYQLVSTGKDGIEIGRTHIYMDAIKIEPCMCLTPPCGPKD